MEGFQTGLHVYAFVVLEVHVTKKSDTEKSKSNRTDSTAASSNGKYYCWLCCSPQLVSPWWLEKWSQKGQWIFWNQHLRNPWNEKAYVVTLSGILCCPLKFHWMMVVASEKQVAWTCVDYIVVGVFDTWFTSRTSSRGTTQNSMKHKTS